MPESIIPRPPHRRIVDEADIVDRRSILRKSRKVTHAPPSECYLESITSSNVAYIGKQNPPSSRNLQRSASTRTVGTLDTTTTYDRYASSRRSIFTDPSFASGGSSGESCLDDWHAEATNEQAPTIPLRRKDERIESGIVHITEPIRIRYLPQHEPLAKAESAKSEPLLPDISKVTSLNELCAVAKDLRRDNEHEGALFVLQEALRRTPEEDSVRGARIRYEIAKSEYAMSQQYGHYDVRTMQSNLYMRAMKCYEAELGDVRRRRHTSKTIGARNKWTHVEIRILHDLARLYEEKFGLFDKALRCLEESSILEIRLWNQSREFIEQCSLREEMQETKRKLGLLHVKMGKFNTAVKLSF